VLISRFLVPAILLVLTFFPNTLPDAFEVNLWSLNLSKVVTVPGEVSFSVVEGLFNELPASHWRGQVALARAAVQAQAPDEALKWLELADLDLPLIHKVKAEALAATGDLLKALAEWEKAKDISALQLAGKEAFASGRKEEGIAARRAWFRVDPVGGALALAAAIWRVDRDATRSAELLEKTLGEYYDAPVPTRLNLWYALGNYRRLTKAWDRAEVAYQQLAELDSEDFRSYIGRGWLVYQRDGDVEGALTWFRQAQEKAPERGEPWVEGGSLLRREKRHAEAERWFGEAIKRNPRNKYWRIYRANNIREFGDLEYAFALYGETAELFPDFPNIYYELAWTYSMAENHEEALETAIKAVELTSGRNTTFLVRVGLIAERAGHFSEAIYWFECVLKRSPNHPTARAALARLRGGC